MNGREAETERRSIAEEEEEEERAEKRGMSIINDDDDDPNWSLFLLIIKIASSQKSPAGASKISRNSLCLLTLTKNRQRHRTRFKLIKQTPSQTG